MQKIKIIFWLIILGLVGIFVYQNYDFLFRNEEIKINIIYGNPYKLSLPVAIYFLAFFVVGFLIAYFLSLSQKFHSRKAIRQLNETIKASHKKIMELEEKLATTQTVSSQPVYFNDKTQLDIVES